MTNKEVAEIYGLHPNMIADLQRKKVLPRDITQMTEDHMDFLTRFRILASDEKILRMQLNHFSGPHRKAILDAVEDYHYKRWEQYVLRRCRNLINKKKEIHVPIILTEIYRMYGVYESKYVENRVHQLKDREFKRRRRGKG